MEDIAGQMLISGSHLSYFNGQDFVEYGFTEKPLVEKSDTDDYDRWPYGDLLEVDLPELDEIDADQILDKTASVSFKKSPYMVNSVRFTASTVGTNIGVTTGSGYSGVAADLQLRFVTDFSDDTETPIATDQGYGTDGALKNVYWDVTNNRLVVEFEGAPETLDILKEHPQAILLKPSANTDFVVYEFMFFDKTNLSTGQLFAYYYNENAVIEDGVEYEVKIPQSDMYVNNALGFVVQEDDADNNQTSIEITEILLRKIYNYRFNSVEVTC